jgi:hypothetical protein
MTILDPLTGETITINVGVTRLPPMDLANMREHGVRSVAAQCQEIGCGHLLRAPPYCCGYWVRPARHLHSWRNDYEPPGAGSERVVVNRFLTISGQPHRRSFTRTPRICGFFFRIRSRALQRVAGETSININPAIHGRRLLMRSA